MWTIEVGGSRQACVKVLIMTMTNTVMWGYDVIRYAGIRKSENRRTKWRHFSHKFLCQRFQWMCRWSHSSWTWCDMWSSLMSKWYVQLTSSIFKWFNSAILTEHGPGPKEQSIGTLLGWKTSDKEKPGLSTARTDTLFIERARATSWLKQQLSLLIYPFLGTLWIHAYHGLSVVCRMALPTLPLKPRWVPVPSHVFDV